MNISTINNVCLVGISCIVPENIINNDEFAKKFFPNDDFSSTIKALGVKRRHVCRYRKNTSLVLGVSSAENLINRLNYDLNKIGAVVFVTLTPDSLMPNNASAAHHLLSLSSNCAAFDINHACSGYTYGLWISSLICQNIKKSVLLIDADTNSFYVSKKDKATSLLFGDAGSASIVEYDQKSEPIDFCFFTDAEKRDALTLPGFGFKKPLTEDSLKEKSFTDGSIRRDIDMFMDGENVFNYVVNNVPKHVRNFLDRIEMEPEEFKNLVLHQANAFMLRRLAKKIGFKLDKIPYSIQEYGNTSSVSIPLTIASQNSDYDFSGNNLFVGMGAGLSTGIVSINLSSLKHRSTETRDL